MPDITKEILGMEIDDLTRQLNAYQEGILDILIDLYNQIIDNKKLTRLLCVLCRNIELGKYWRMSHLSDNDSVPRNLQKWRNKHMKNCTCWEKENKQARERRLKKKIEKELQGLDKRTKAYRRAKRPSSEAMQKLVGF